MPSSTAPAYNQTTAFSAFNPSSFPNFGTNIDTEFANLNTTLDAMQLNIADVRRSDGALANGIVRQESLHAEIYAGLNTPSVWATATAYVLRDSVVRDGVLYKCIVAHTSGTFSTDLAAAKWSALIDFSLYSGPQLSDSTPTALAAATSATAGVGLTASRYDHVHATTVFGLLAGSRQTSGFTAVSNTFYRCAFSAAATITLPASPAAGDVIGLAVYGQVVTIGRNGKTINGLSADLVIPDCRQTFFLTYDSTLGDWT